MNEDLLRNLNVVHLEDSDIILLKLSHKIHQDESWNLRDYFKEYFPKNKILILGPEADLNILKQPETSENIDPRDINLDKDLFGKEES